MDIRHQKLGFPDEFSVFLPFDGAYGDGATFIDVEAVGLAGVHLGVGRAVAHQGALADLGVDTPWDQEGDVDVGILQLQRLIESEQSVFGSTVSGAQGEAE